MPDQVEKAKIETPINVIGLGAESTFAVVESRGAKFTRAEASYREPAPSSYSTCSACRFFLRADSGEIGGCQVVDGPIAWFGISNLYISASAESSAAFEAIEQAKIVARMTEGIEEIEAVKTENGAASLSRVPAFVKETLAKIGAYGKKRRKKEDLEKKIERRGDKYVLLSEDGSKILGSFDTKDEAVERLRQIEGHKKGMGNDKEEMEKAPLSSAVKNNLPDSSFAIILPGGKKDGSGKTVPRSLRMFPFKTASGEIDKPRLRNALARIEQNNRLNAEQKSKVRAKLESAARKAGVGKPAEESKKLVAFIPFTKTDEEKRLVTGVVMEPNVIDLQGDFTDEEEIEKAAHAFMQKSRIVGKEHTTKAKAEVVESYITATDMIFGEQKVRKGSWVMTVKIHDDGFWTAVKSGEFTGFSIGGRSMKIAEQEIEVEDEDAHDDLLE